VERDEERFKLKLKWLNNKSSELQYKVKVKGLNGVSR
jgi:hypothetical protein